MHKDKIFSYVFPVLFSFVHKKRVGATIDFWNEQNLPVIFLLTSEEISPKLQREAFLVCLRAKPKPLKWAMW